MSTVGLTAGLVCAVAIFLFFSRLDRATIAAQELPPADELRGLSRRRRSLAYQLDRLGQRFGRGLPEVVTTFRASSSDSSPGRGGARSIATCPMRSTC